MAGSPKLRTPYERGSYLYAAYPTFGTSVARYELAVHSVLAFEKAYLLCPEARLPARVRRQVG